MRRHRNKKEYEKLEKIYNEYLENPVVDDKKTEKKNAERCIPIKQETPRCPNSLSVSG